MAHFLIYQLSYDFCFRIRRRKLACEQPMIQAEDFLLILPAPSTMICISLRQVILCLLFPFVPI